MYAFYMHQHPQAYPMLVLEHKGDKASMNFGVYCNASKIL
jgi:hypothetical protein